MIRPVRTETVTKVPCPKFLQQGFITVKVIYIIICNNRSRE